MHSKRKSKISNLVAIVVFLIIALCFVCGFTYGTAESSVAQLSDEVDIVATSNTYEDFSSYTNQELPDKIDKNNISQYVPVNRFNHNGTIVYNGRNYGFIIFSDANTNHVLLFKEMYMPHDDGDGYEITLKIIYENSFFVGANNDLIYAGSPYHIALSNIKFDNLILDSDINNNIAYENYNSYIDSGAYYTQVRYENQFSYYDKQLAADTAVAVVSTIGTVLSFIPKVKVVGDILGVASTVASDISVIYSLAQAEGNLWIDNSNFDTDIDFPLTREGQLEKYGSLKKDVRIDVQADKDEFLTAENGGDFARAIYRVMNDNRKDYYVNNQISFEIWRYNGSESSYKVDENYIESVYCVTGTDCYQYGQLIEQDGFFVYEDYQRFAPMTNVNLFKFIPDIPGEYSFIIPNGYYLTIDGKSQLSNVIKVDAYGCIVGISSSLDSNNGAAMYSRLLPQDFYNGEISFTNIMIQKKQQLRVNDTTLVGQLAYTIESNSATHNDIYILEAGEFVDLLDLYIINNEFKVLAKAVKKDGNLYVNYPMKVNGVYSLVCVNRSGKLLDLTLIKQDGMTVQDYQSNKIQGLYYSFTPEYSQLYNTQGAKLYDENMTLYTNNDAFLQAGGTYFLYSESQNSMAISFSEFSIFTYTTLGKEIISQNDFNEMFRFMPVLTALYSFESGTFDVYESNILVAQDVNQCVLQKNTSYHIIKKQFGGVIKVYLDGGNLYNGENNISITNPYSVFKLSIDERNRFDISVNNGNSLAVYDVFLNEIEQDHGYLLEAGTYYVIVKNIGESCIAICEFIQQVNITFYDEGNIYVDETGNSYYYGKRAVLPVPTKERYDFDGWSLNNVKITDVNGLTIGELLVDEIILVATWTLRSVILEVNFGNGHSVWWTGDGFVSGNPGGQKIEGDYINALLNMKDDFAQLDYGKKQGYFISTIDYVKTSSEENVDYYEFTPIWQKERYLIEFIVDSSNIYKTNRPVYYGEEIINTVFPMEAFSFGDERKFLKGWKISEDTKDIIIFLLGYVIPDLTPGYGSNYTSDYDGDGQNDYTLVRLSADIGNVKYAIEINGNIKNVPEEGYIIEGLKDYGYNEEIHYGYNVLLETVVEKASSIAKITVALDGGIIKIDNLTAFWKSGERNVIVEMQKVCTPITVLLKYDCGVSGNPSKYVGAKFEEIEKDKDKQITITLNLESFVRGYLMVDWTVDGSAIKKELNYNTLKIERYYSDVNDNVIDEKNLYAKLERTTIKPFSATSKVISDNVVYVDLSRSKLMTGLTFTITKDVQQVTFANGSCRDSQITVKSRSNQLVINFQNAQFSALSGQSAINASECPNLELYSYDGNTVLTGGEATLKEGGVAILCNNLTLKGETFKIVGGASNYINYNARAGIYGIGKDNTLTIGARNVTVIGGSCEYGKVKKDRPNDNEFTKADQGKNGAAGEVGKTGANGAVAIYFPGIVEINAGSNLKCVGGKGGYGGQGSNGQRGGDGKNGVFLGPTTVKPGNGGNGGGGGKGGNGAIPMTCTSLVKNGNYTAENGAAGEGGYGGYGAIAGASSHTWDNKTTYTGRNGSDGIEGSKGAAGVSTFA